MTEKKQLFRGSHHESRTWAVTRFNLCKNNKKKTKTKQKKFHPSLGNKHIVKTCQTEMCCFFSDMTYIQSYTQFFFFFLYFNKDVAIIIRWKRRRVFQFLRVSGHKCTITLMLPCFFICFTPDCISVQVFILSPIIFNCQRLQPL